MGLDQWSVLQIHENELPRILKDYGISVYMLIINDFNVGPTLLLYGSMNSRTRLYQINASGEWWFS